MSGEMRRFRPMAADNGKQATYVVVKIFLANEKLGVFEVMESCHDSSTGSKKAKAYLADNGLGPDFTYGMMSVEQYLQCIPSDAEGRPLTTRKRRRRKPKTVEANNA